MINELLIATTNQGKLLELDRAISSSGIRLRSLSDLGITVDVDETGSTFAENAGIKASAYASISGKWTLADDSGLEIKCLKGRPGVYSARYGGDGLTFADRMQMILSEMLAEECSDRSARFICSVAIADQSGRIAFRADGVCTGQIALKPSGELGFGYDPIFIPDGFTETFGVLESYVKAQISHRSDAISKIIPFLQGFSVA